MASVTVLIEGYYVQDGPRLLNRRARPRPGEQVIVVNPGTVRSRVSLLDRLEREGVAAGDVTS